MIFGLMGFALMVFSIKLPSNLIVDFRNLTIFLSAISGGWVSAALTTLVLSFFRILFYGINTGSIAAIIVFLLNFIIFCIIGRLRIKNSLKWLFSIGISELVTYLAFTILISDEKLLYEIALSYSISISIVSFLLYHYLGYMEALTESFRKYKRESKKDFLTGLNNVRQFDNLYNDIVRNIAAEGGIMSLLFIDIDFFKKVNDTYGHKEGDIILIKLGEVLLTACRGVDIVSRNGGEEFSVILVNCPPAKAVEIAERIRKMVESTLMELSNKTKINITISIGVASYPDPISDINMLTEKADMALYEAKRTGRNKVVFSH